MVDKPPGPTSHDAVDRVRHALHVRRVGHTGTLDPFATGVLPVCVGKATRLARFLAVGDKSYRATVRLGFSTTTDDVTGEALGEARPVDVSRAALEQACRALTGPLLQVPPSYSARRVGGQRLYALARAGQVTEREASPVTIHALEVLRAEGDEVDLEVRCSPGTYVRALARDLGTALGTGGHLTALRRTRSGSFGLEQAVGWDDISAEGPGAMLPLAALLPELPAAAVGEAGREAIRFGRSLHRSQVLSGFPAGPDPPPRMRVVDGSGHLLALAVPQAFGFQAEGLKLEPVLHPDVVLLD